MDECDVLRLTLLGQYQLSFNAKPLRSETVCCQLHSAGEQHLEALVACQSHLIFHQWKFLSIWQMIQHVGSAIAVNQSRAAWNVAVKIKGTKLFFGKYKWFVQYVPSFVHLIGPTAGDYLLVFGIPVTTYCTAWFDIWSVSLFVFLTVVILLFRSMWSSCSWYSDFLPKNCVCNNVFDTFN